MNSSIAIAFVGGLVGAFGGALGAQHIVERNKSRDELLKELRNINSAIMVSFSICNFVLALKKQHVLPMYDKFQQDETALKKFQEQLKLGQLPNNSIFQFQADFKTFAAPTTPIVTLIDIVYSKISAYGRPLALVAILEQSLEGLSDAIAKRDNLIKRFAKGEISSELTPYYYFGMQLKDGHTNQEHPDIIKAIYSYTDDVVFFSALLCDDLVMHGKSVHEKYLEKHKRGAPQISKVDFSGPREQGLIPPNSQYEDWLKWIISEKSSKTETGAKS